MGQNSLPEVFVGLHKKNPEITGKKSKKGIGTIKNFRLILIVTSKIHRK